MAFYSSLIGTVFKMAVVAVFAYIGILTGKRLRANKDAKKSAETEQ